MADNDLFRSMQEAIDEARREGRAEGAAALAEALRDFLSSFSIDEAPRPPRAESQIPKGRVGAPREYAPRIPRSVSESLIVDVFKSIAPRPAGPTEVQHAILRDKNMDIPFTTLRRVIDSLTERRQLEAIGDTKTWRWVGGDAGRDEGSTVRHIRQTG
jgi:hypothetical protein